MSMSAARLVTVLVVDHTLVIVSCCHGRLRSESHHPPQMSTTVSPSMSSTMLAPSSSFSSCSASASRTGAKRASHVPDTSAMDPSSSWTLAGRKSDGSEPMRLHALTEHTSAAYRTLQLVDVDGKSALSAQIYHRGRQSQPTG